MEITYEQRLLIMREQTMWTIHAMLREECESALDDSWKPRIRVMMEEAKKLAEEIRDYNDQYEVE